jgi:hypothetical protein
MTAKAKKLMAMLSALISLGGLVGWYWHDKQYPTWQEEVQLSDGRKITITQKRKYFENYGTDQSWVTFSLPEMGGEQTWHSYAMPMRIDIHNNSIYAFGLPRGPKQIAYYHYPKYMIVAFSWNGHEFERIPFTQVPPELRLQENIYRCIPAGHPKLLTLADKEKSWCPPDGDQKQFTKKINIDAYLRAGSKMAILSGGPPLSE